MFIAYSLKWTCTCVILTNNYNKEKNMHKQQVTPICQPKFSQNKQNKVCCHFCNPEYFAWQNFSGQNIVITKFPISRPNCNLLLVDLHDLL